MTITQAFLNSEISTKLPTNNIGEIPASDLRQTLTDMVTAIFQNTDIQDNVGVEVTISAPLNLAPATYTPILGQSQNTNTSQPCFFNFSMAGENTNQATYGLFLANIDYGFGGSALQGARIGLNVYAHFDGPPSTNPSPFYSATQIVAEAFNPDTSSSTMSSINSFALLQSGATGWHSVYCTQYSAGILTGASAQVRTALNVSAIGQVLGSSVDAGVILGCTTGAVAFEDGILFSHSFNGAAPIATSGTVFGTDGQSDTVANVMDFHTWTVSNFIFDFANYTVTGAGVTTGASYKVGANQVVGARQTGWTVATGTPSRATYATASVTLATLAGVVMALEQDLISHGLIGT
jgi:hypothetical protein